MEDNLYQLLGVSPNATIQQIHKAYLTLAKQLHPDKNKASPTATVDFQKLNHAYHVLKEPETRREYDRKNMGYWEQSQNYAEVNEEEHSTYEGISTKVNTMSLTICIPPDMLDTWITVMQERYEGTFRDAKQGQPDKGQMIKVKYQSEGGPLGTVSITVYKTTSKLHIQGTPFFLWLNEHLPELERSVSEVLTKKGFSLGPHKRRSKRQLSITPSPGSGSHCKICSSVITKDGRRVSQCTDCGDSWHDNCATESGISNKRNLCFVCLNLQLHPPPVIRHQREY